MLRAVGSASIAVTSTGGLPIAAAGGTVNAITADYTPDVVLADKLMVQFVSAGANTSAAPTFSPDGITAHPITARGGAALRAGDIGGAGFVGQLCYNAANTRWELLNPATAEPSIFNFMTAAQIADVVSNTGSVDLNTVFLNALATVTPGGSMRFPKGTYLIKRGNGSAVADNVIADNVTIYGDGPGTIITSLPASGTLADDPYNELYNVFQATSRKNVTLRDMSFSGPCVPLSAISCSGVVVQRIYDNALLANASGYLRDKTLYFYKTSDIKVVDCHFLNLGLGVYLSGDTNTRTSGIIANNSFENNTAAGAFTCLFPAGIYCYYVDNLIVQGNTFKNIYSSLDDGNTGTGMGYAVYEGDGATRRLQVLGNHFQYDGNGSKRAIGVLTTTASSALVSENQFYAAVTASLTNAIRGDTNVASSEFIFSKNIVNTPSASGSTDAIQININAASTNVQVDENKFTGGRYGIHINGNTVNFGGVIVKNNVIRSPYYAGIIEQGSSGAPLVFTNFHGNTVTGCGYNALWFNGYVVSPIIKDNVLLDGNLLNQAEEPGAAIYFTDSSFGVDCRGNTIGNTVAGGGKFTCGVCNNNVTTASIFKWSYGENNFLGFANNVQFGTFNGNSVGHTASPTVSIFDANKGDFVRNVQLDAAEAPGWHCVKWFDKALTADASSAIESGTGIHVADTTGLAGGDLILLTKDTDPYDADYSDAAKWHATTIDSVTNGTDLVLTAAIPAGDGTYASGTAHIKVALYKAEAVIAS